MVIFLLCLFRLLNSRLRLRVLKLAVPCFLDAGNSLVAEVEPALELGALFNVFLVIALILAAILLVKLLLSQMAQLKRDLYNLTEVHS